MLGYMSGCARARRWVEHDVAGVSGHEKAAFNRWQCRLDDVNWELFAMYIVPNIGNSYMIPIIPQGHPA
jgi:hypothetical protein